MKRFKLLLVALATISFTAFYSCGDTATDEGTETENTETPEDAPTVETETETETTETEVTSDSTEVAVEGEEVETEDAK